MAVIEYADADSFRLTEGTILFHALKELAERNPWFSGPGTYRAKSLILGGLREQSLAAIFDDASPFRFRQLLAEQFENSSLLRAEIDRIRRFVLSSERPARLRESLAISLMKSLGPADRNQLVEDLLSAEKLNDARVATSAIIELGVECFSDDLVADAVMTASGFGRTGAIKKDSLFGSLWRYRSELPDKRLPSFLDSLAALANVRLSNSAEIESSELRSFGNRLIARSLESHRLDSERLATWLKAFSGMEGYEDSDSKIVGDFLQNQDELRRSVQRKLLGCADDPGNLRLAAFELGRVHPRLTLSDQDFADFVSRLPSSYVHWRDIASIVRHSAESGSATREAMRRFAANEVEYDKWVQATLNPPTPRWKIEQDARKKRFNDERLANWRDFRNDMQADLSALQTGQFSALAPISKVYFGHYRDLNDLGTIDERLNAVIGPELRQLFIEGLENWLSRAEQTPSADIVAQDYAKNLIWNDRYIWLAALRERLRQTGTLSHCEAEHIVIAQLHIAHHWAEGSEWEQLRSAVFDELQQDDAAFERYSRLICEPALWKGTEIVSGLYDLLNETSHRNAETVLSLACEWLSKIWRMHWRPERELIQFVLAQGRESFLRSIVGRRLKMKSLTRERKLTWQAVATIVDLANSSEKSAEWLKKDPDLFWVIRDFLRGPRPYDEIRKQAPTDLAAWLVEQARTVFPYSNRPDGTTSGDTNSWDASEYVKRLISAIAASDGPEVPTILANLATVQDGYQKLVLSVSEENRQRRAESQWKSLQIEQLSALASDSVPLSLADLQQEILALLDQAEAMIKSDDIDSWRGFFKSDLATPKEEEDCSDALIGILRQLTSKVRFKPENHLGNDREGDIECTAGKLYIPIEAKGQWHRDLWSAADKQLREQQAVDHRAQGFGILLVYWFGDATASKRLRAPPRSLGLAKPLSPHELEEDLSRSSTAVRSGRIRIKVMDLSRR
ncbi:MAG TPA: hypothetical protein EYG57_13570 [Planctomycetes bacterium]|nr:hypothetical protein [Planctomycetota bacterium]